MTVLIPASCCKICRPTPAEGCEQSSQDTTIHSNCRTMIDTDKSCETAPS